MFIGGIETYEATILENPDKMKFSDFADFDKLLRTTHEIAHPLIIVDDPDLKLSTIDVSLSKLKAKYGELLTMGVVDYLNEVKLDGKSDPYDWVYQKEVATGLKYLARKHDLAIIAPYQVDDTGEARFSKSILDPVDMAFVVTSDHEKGTMLFASTKLRSLPASVFKVPVDWRTLTIHPEDLPLSEEDTAEKEEPSRSYPKKDKKPKEPLDPNPKYDDLGGNNFELN
jgi:hypothetical protein